MVVDSTLVDLATPKTLTLGASIADLIETGAPSADTLYNIYLNSTGVGLSAYAPLASGYMTGDATRRFFGAVYLDANKECAKEWNFCGFGRTIVSDFLASNITRTSGSGYYTVLTLDNVVTLENTISRISGKVTFYQDGITTQMAELYRDSTYIQRHYTYSGSAIVSTHNLEYSLKSIAIEAKEIHSTYRYIGSGTTVVYSGADESKILLERSTA